MRCPKTLDWSLNKNQQVYAAGQTAMIWGPMPANY